MACITNVLHEPINVHSVQGRQGMAEVIFHEITIKI